MASRPPSGAPSTLCASTDEVEGPRRFDYWQDVLSDQFGGTELRRHANGFEPFSARLRWVELGSITLSRVSGCAAEVVRPRATGPSSPRSAARYHVEIPLQGVARLAQSGREVILRPGDFALCDNGLPFHYGFPSAYDELVIQIPREVLLGREPRADQLTAVPVRSDAGLGSLLSLLLERVADLELWSGSPVACVFAAHLVDLVVTALSAQLGPPERSVARSRYLFQAHAYLHDHLGDPGLSPERVARSVGISPRYLYALFHNEGTTVSRWLTERRLERSRLLLGTDRYAALSITEVARAIGFRDLSHFSSSFKAAFGISPRAYREHVRATKGQQHRTGPS